MSVKYFILFLSIMIFSACGSHEENKSDLDANGTGIISTVFGVVKELLLTGEGVDGVLVGEGLPNFDNVLDDISGGKNKTSEFIKEAESVIIGSELFKVKYEISYRYGSSYKGKGKYLQNVMFLPLEVSVDPTIKLKVKIISEKPVNLSDDASTPVAGLSFNLIWTVSSLVGSVAKTDNFSVHGETGKLKTKFREFD